MDGAGAESASGSGERARWHGTVAHEQDSQERRMQQNTAKVEVHYSCGVCQCLFPGTGPSAFEL
jgi:hypothetical protein